MLDCSVVGAVVFFVTLVSLLFAVNSVVTFVLADDLSVSALGLSGKLHPANNPKETMQKPNKS